MNCILILNWSSTRFHAVGACAEFFKIATAQVGDLRIYRLFDLTYLILGFLTFSIIITGVSTSLIILRILSATQGNPAIGNRAPYRKIQRIIIESGAIYLLGLIITAISLAVVSFLPNPRQGTLFYSSHMVLTYSQPLLTPLAVSH